MWKITNLETNESHFWSNGPEDDFLQFVPDHFGMEDHSKLKFERHIGGTTANDLNDMAIEEGKKGIQTLIDLDRPGKIALVKKVIDEDMIPPRFDDDGNKISSAKPEEFHEEDVVEFDLEEVEWPYEEIVKKGKKILKFKGFK